MTRDELLKHHADLNSRGLEIMDAKNRDYAGQDGDQPFANFEVVEKLGITSTEIGILVRLCDKFKRIVNFVESGTFAVKEESFTDTIVDARTYLAILDAWLKDKGDTT